MKTYNVKIYILLLLFVSTGLQGQDISFSSYRFGATPTSLLNFFPAFQFSLDRAIGERSNLAMELGYVFASETGAQGVRIRPGIEYMLARGEYIALTGGLHCNTRFTIEYREVVNRSRSNQFEYLRFNNRRSRLYMGLNLSSNLLIKLSERLFMEVGGGIGLATYQIFDNTPLAEGERVDFLESPFTPVESIDLYPIFYPHMNFSYTISVQKGDRKRSKSRKRQ